MKKRLISSMLCFMFVAVFCFIMLPNTLYAAEQSITFDDQTLYKGIKIALADKITSFEDSTKTITMTKDNIDSVTEINLNNVILNNIGISERISNIRGIENFTNLKSLDLAGNQVSTLDNFEKMTNLTYLNIKECPISDISALNGAMSLEKLDASKCQISDISVLSNLKNLTYINLNANNINDISALKELPAIKTIALNYNKINDSQLTNLSKLTTLESLDLSSNDNISDISALKDLKSLVHLDISTNNLTDISVISNFVNLEHLALGENKISDITPLKNLINLKRLELIHNKISDISPLKNLTNLTEYLGLGFNQVEDITPLRDMNKLTYLDLANNHVYSIDAIKNLDALEDSKTKLERNTKTFEIPGDTKKYSLPSLYTTKGIGLKITNGTLSKDGTEVILNEGLKKGDKVTIQIIKPDDINSLNSTLTLLLTSDMDNEKEEPVTPPTTDNDDKNTPPDDNTDVVDNNGEEKGVESANPNTGDILLYVGFIAGVAAIVYVATTKSRKKINVK